MSRKEWQPGPIPNLCKGLSDFNAPSNTPSISFLGCPFIVEKMYSIGSLIPWSARHCSMNPSTARTAKVKCSPTSLRKSPLTSSSKSARDMDALKACTECCAAIELNLRKTIALYLSFHFWVSANSERWLLARNSAKWNAENPYSALALVHSLVNLRHWFGGDTNPATTTVRESPCVPLSSKYAVKAAT